MTPDELRAALKRLGLTMAGASRRWGVPYRTLQDWCNGAAKPAPILDHLIALELGAVKPLKGSGDE